MYIFCISFSVYDKNKARIEIKANPKDICGLYLPYLPILMYVYFET